MVRIARDRAWTGGRGLHESPCSSTLAHGTSRVAAWQQPKPSGAHAMAAPQGKRLAGTGEDGSQQSYQKCRKTRPLLQQVQWRLS